MASITIKYIPDELYKKLKTKAAMHLRSINNEMINCLESWLMPQRITISERIQRARWISHRQYHENEQERSHPPQG